MMRAAEDITFPFVHLHVHSYYSFFGSTLSPADIVAWAAGRREVGTTRAEAADEPVGDLLAERATKGWGAGRPAENSGWHGEEALRAVALTDTNSMTGSVEFYEAAQALGVKPILGLELTQPFAHERQLLRQRAAVGHVPGEEEMREEEEGGSAGMMGSQSPALCHGDLTRRTVLLARNLEGYHELSRLATRRMLDADFDLLEAVGQTGGDVIMASDWPEALRAGRGREAGTTYGLLVPGRTRRLRNRAVYEECARLGMPLVVGCDARMATPAEADLLRLLEAMRELKTVAQVAQSGREGGGPGCLWSGGQIAAMFGLGRGHALEETLREAMANTVRVAQMCDCRLPIREWKFPKFAGDSGESRTLLAELARAGLRWRYGEAAPAQAQARLEHELGIIAQLGFSDYFLLVHRIVEEAGRRGFFTLGRGSAANSIVTYVLGISHVCPLRNGLQFERFLNPERSSPPDIDLDFSWRERDEILRWCFEFFGEEKVALISTIQTLRLRQAVREVGKAYGLSPEELNGFNRLKRVGYVVEELEAGAGAGGGGALARRRELAIEEPWRTILEQGRRLAGWPRHLSIHCGGVVIAPEAVSRWMPLTRSAKGFVITQMDMVGVEELGLVKMDLLSNRSLGVLKDTLAAAEIAEAKQEAAERQGEVRGEGKGEEKERRRPAEEAGSVATGGAGEPQERRGTGERSAVLAHEAARMKLAGTRRGTSVALAGLLEQFEQGETAEGAGAAEHSPAGARPLRERIFDLEAITRDAATRALIHEGRTMGCFYIESPGMRALFERLHCREFAEVVAASSIIRPGVAESGMMDEYIARHQGRGRSERRFARVQELLRRLLPETYGVMVYQEDVLLVAHEVAGMSYGEADVLRRAMSGKTRSGETMAAARERFVRGAMQRHGLTAEEAGEIWRQVASFAGYSFCKGHSAAFAVLSYQVAFLKAHWPAEFFAAVIDNGGGFYGAGAYVEEARRWGLRVLGPCVNAGDVHYRGATCWAQHLHASGWVRVGLGAVSEVSPATCERIVAERRRGGAFGSVADFLRRVRPVPHEARQLARAGALDTLVAREEALAADVRTRCRARQQIMLQLELAFRDATLWHDGEQLFDSEAVEQDNDGLGGGTPGRIEQENAAGRIDAGTEPGESDRKKRARLGAGAAMGIALENVGGGRCGGAGQKRGEGDGINGKDYAAPGRRGDGGKRCVSRNSKSGDGARTAAAGGSAGSELEARARLCRWEMQTLGFMVSGHPLDFVEIPDATVAARDIRRFAGRRVVMVGWAIAAKELAASNSGLPMKMLTLEDRTDTFEAVLFPKVYACFAPRTLSCGPYCVRGRVDMRLGSPTVNVENIEVLPLHLEQ